MEYSAIAVTGLACVFADANTPAELWENVLSQRRAFRRIPAERLCLEDYYSADVSAPDSTYSFQAALIANYEFDRVGFRVAGSTFRSADLAHWLALDVANKALADAGFVDGRGLPHETTGVVLGNTLTGEFSRANLMRLRWPYVRRIVGATLDGEMTQAGREALLDRLEAAYKSPFPPVGEESLSGGLSNTIAGRICNHFNLNGGGYTVDGACASSLLAVSQACAALAAGDLDVALAGGVDLSLDPFELVGFAKAGALAPDEMRVFDRRSAGFWPGEGCGFVVLMRLADALARRRRVYSVIRGWGVSSDGNGGLTRPEPRGQLEAVRRAYRRAGYNIDTIGYFEAHGTGTAVGDTAELEVLSRARRDANAQQQAAIGSIKAIIGHTKAAAGVAGLLKATMAVDRQVLPPTTGCEQLHPLLSGSDALLRPVREPECWPGDRPLRAAVSAMGFGGINTHVTLESPATERRRGLSSRESLLGQTAQDCELFLFAAPSATSLAEQVETVLQLAPGLSRAELADLAACLQRHLPTGVNGTGPDGGQQLVRAALVANTATELEERLRRLIAWTKGEGGAPFRFSEGVCLGRGGEQPRIALLFPGQGSPAHLEGGIWRRRFNSVKKLYEDAALAATGDQVSTRVAQPAVVTASLAGLAALEQFGLGNCATAAIGHSLGELTALHWAGACPASALLRIARVRGAAMADLKTHAGAMLALNAEAPVVESLIAAICARRCPQDAGHEPILVIVGFNSPRQTVVAGDSAAIKELAEYAPAAGHRATLLQVSHAFHTSLVAAAVPVLERHLNDQCFARLQRPVFSTITGTRLAPDENLTALLCRQVTAPVRFSSALTELFRAEVGPIDLLLEVGPGEILTTLVNESGMNVPALALDAGGSSLRGLLQSLGAAFALGAPIRHQALFADRFTRPFKLDAKPRFFVNPCELAPRSNQGALRSPDRVDPSRISDLSDRPGSSPEPLELIRQLVAERAELPVTCVKNESRLLSDLHLNSITVGQLVSEAARRLGLPRITGLTDFANATVGEAAQALEDVKRTGAASAAQDPGLPPAGVDTWFETFAVERVETPRPPVRPVQPPGEAAPAHHEWQLFSPQGHPFADLLQSKLAGLAGPGVMVWLPEKIAESDLELLLAAGHAALALRTAGKFILVQHGPGGSGFVRTLNLERPNLDTCVIQVPPAMAQVVEWIVNEAASATGNVEATYDPEGRRWEPRLKWMPSSGDGHSSPSFPVGPDDVLLVTGGGKGIAAECALALARATGVRLALLGRSAPDADSELSQNLDRFIAAGAKCCYVRADVTDAADVSAAVRQAEEALGPITALVHGAGTNTPCLVQNLNAEAFHKTMRPKVQGLENVLAALPTEQMRMLVTFSSIIARTGLAGEADYATANEWLTARTELFAAEHPACRCLALEWSVWSGVGMGERLGRIETLIQHGITPLSVDQGVRIFLDLVQRPLHKVAVIAAGRFGAPPALRMRAHALPLRRFLERPRVYYPEVELIVDAELTETSDPYFADHVLEQEPLLPAVIGLEAMAQAALALAGADRLLALERVELIRPVVASKTATKIRLAALRRAQDLVEVCLRAEQTDFQVDHFRALCRLPGTTTGSSAALNSDDLTGNNAGARGRFGDTLSLDPAQDLYGRLLFHKNRFCRVRSYRLLTARECIAELAPAGPATWFGPYMPAELVLGDPGARDAALHSIQACIPHQRILPTGIDRLIIHNCPSTSGTRFVHARERTRAGNDFVYDVEVTNETGVVLETWKGLRLRAVQALTPNGPWPVALLGPYLERRLEELVTDSHVRVALGRDATLTEAGPSKASRRNTDSLLSRVMGKPASIRHRPDGKPELSMPQGSAAITSDRRRGLLSLPDDDEERNHTSLSVAHARNLTLVVADGANVACDVEPVVARDEHAWRDLLGDARFVLAARIGREQQEAADNAATRLWAAAECLKKAGQAPEAPLVLQAETPDGWVVLRSGALAIVTCVLKIDQIENSLALAVALYEP